MKKIYILLALCGLISGCASTTEIKPDQPLNEIYVSAYDLLERGRYEKAANEFLRVETQYPSSEYASDALIMAAYSRFLDKDYAGSIIILDRFMRFHPGHADVPYVLYLRGMCYYAQVSDVRREPGMSAYALAQFDQLITRYPNSVYAKNARNKVNILKNYIAGKVMYSARNDMKIENWPSAITRLQSVVETAQETVMTPEALYRLTECYTAVGLPGQAHGYGEMLRKNFPDNEWTKKLK